MTKEDLTIVYVDINDLKDAEYNPRKATEKEFEDLKANMQKFGFVDPILVNSYEPRFNVIIGGHFRTRVAKALKYKTVPVVYISIDNIEVEKELNVRLNKNTGSFDFDILGNLFDVADLKSWGFTDLDLGFDIGKEDGLTGKTGISLTERFIVPPFSILDTKQGYWQDRKRAWLEKIGDIEESREDTLFKGSNTEVGKVIHASGTTSHFDPVFAEIMYLWFCVKGGKILDPFGGEQTKGVVAGELKYRYHGVEIRQEQVDVNNEACKNYDDVKYVCGDSNDIGKLIEGNDFDMVFTSPPYYDLEVYSKEDMSALGSYEEFMFMYENIFRECVAKLKDDSFLVVKIGEVRNKKSGEYRNFVGDNISLFLDLGLTYFNEIIIANSINSLPLRAGRQFNSGRKIAKAHQNVLVFYKGKLSNIKAKFGDVIPDDIMSDEDEDGILDEE